MFMSHSYQQTKANQARQSKANTTRCLRPLSLPPWSTSAMVISMCMTQYLMRLHQLMMSANRAMSPISKHLNHLHQNNH